METKEETTKTTTSLIEQMFEVGAHYGYSKSRRHPSFSSFIFGTKNGSDVINLEKTSEDLNKALGFLKEMASENKTILFVGTKPEIRKIVEDAALALDTHYMTNRWIGGLLTNFSEMKKRFKKLDGLRSKKEKGELSVYTKKEQILINQEIDELTRNFGGVVSMTRLPDVMFVVDSRHENTAITEAQKKGIPVVALASSDCNVKSLDYFIPANDSNNKVVSFFVDKVVVAIKEGLKNPKPKPAETPKVEKKKAE